MNWTLLVPGALLPPALAPELTQHLRAPVLAAQLALAKPVPPRIASAATVPLDSGATQPPHWQWLARRFGLDPHDLPTAPYVWQHARRQEPPASLPAAHDTVARELWVAHCEPVHLAIARDHFVVTDLASAPLQPAASASLLERANAVLDAEAASGARADSSRLRIAEQDGRWFLVSPQPLQLTTWALDAVLGQSVQYRLPTGPDARRWRVLANEIQMSWHASPVNDAREDSGQRAVNGLWLHGGGVWQPLAAMPAVTLHADDAPLEGAVIHGWQGAAAVRTDLGTPGETLSICRTLFDAHAHQAWESWLAQMPALDARLASELDAARAAGATRFDLVLCGSASARTVTVPLQTPWWRRLRAATPAPAALVQRWLAEPAAAGAFERTASPGALAA